MCDILPAAHGFLLGVLPTRQLLVSAPGGHSDVLSGSFSWAPSKGPFGPGLE